MSLAFPGEVVGQFGVGGAGEGLSSLLVTGLLSLGSVGLVLGMSEGFTVHGGQRVSARGAVHAGRWR